MYDDNKLALSICLSSSDYDTIFDLMKTNGQLEILFPFEPQYCDKALFYSLMKSNAHLFMVTYNGKPLASIFLNNFINSSVEVSFALFGSLRTLLDAGNNIAEYFLHYYPVLIAKINEDHAIGKKFVKKIGFKKVGDIPNYYGTGKNVTLFSRIKKL